MKLPWKVERRSTQDRHPRGYGALIVAAAKKDREPSEKGPEGSLALSRCAGTEERSGGVMTTSEFVC